MPASVYGRFGRLGAQSSNSSSNDTDCVDGVQWMWTILGDCVIGTREEASEYLGLASMIIWMMVGIPQIIKNFRNLEGLAGVSFFLLFQWAGGDITNLIGSILTGQLPFQIYLAIYFVFSDMVLLLQYLAYKLKARAKKRAQETFNPGANGYDSSVPRVIMCFGIGAIFLCSKAIFPSPFQPLDEAAWVDTASSKFMSRSLLSVSEASAPVTSDTDSIFFKSEAKNGGDRKLDLGLPMVKMGMSVKGAKFDDLLDSSSGEDTSFWHNEMDVIGYAIGVVSSIFYLGSRTAQIIKNTKTGSTEGLAFLTFFLAILGNTAYGLQILVYSLDTEFLLEKTPWLVGSLGVIGLDCTLLGQFYYYGKRNKQLEEERKALLNKEYTVNVDPPPGRRPTWGTNSEDNEQNHRDREYIY